MEEFQRLQMEATFTQDLYKAALTALEKRPHRRHPLMLEKVSVLQTPTLAEYPMEPAHLQRRHYLVVRSDAGRHLGIAGKHRSRSRGLT